MYGVSGPLHQLAGVLGPGVIACYNSEGHVTVAVGKDRESEILDKIKGKLALVVNYSR